MIRRAWIVLNEGSGGCPRLRSGKSLILRLTARGLRRLSDRLHRLVMEPISRQERLGDHTEAYVIGDPRPFRKGRHLMRYRLCRLLVTQ